MHLTPGALLIVSITLIATSVIVIPSFAAGSGSPTPQYIGRAIGVLITTPLATLRFADAGPLPASGGSTSATLVNVQTPAANAQVLLSVTSGFDGHAESQATVAYAALLPGSPDRVTADVVFAQSDATCTGVSGFSSLANLAVGGEKVVVSGSPNQVVSIPGVLTLVINEQILGPGKSITVNALHLTTVSGIKVIVSSAHSDIVCPPPPHLLAA
jgi:hypothetical protein